MELQTGTPFVCAGFKWLKNAPPDNFSFLYQIIPSPLFLWEIQFLSKVELQTETLSKFAKLKFCTQGSKIPLQTFPSFINVFPDHSFSEKINVCQKRSCRHEPSLSVWNLHFAHKALKCSSGPFLPLSIYQCSFCMQLCFWHAALLHCTIVHILAPALLQFCLWNLSKHWMAEEGGGDDDELVRAECVR